MSRGPEAQIQDWTIKYLRQFLPYVYVRKIHQSRFSRKGIPDLIGVYNGIFFSIEIKTDTGHMTKLQEIEYAEIQRAKGHCLVMFGKNKEMLNKLIDYLKSHAITPR